VNHHEHSGGSQPKRGDDLEYSNGDQSNHLIPKLGPWGGICGLRGYTPRSCNYPPEAAGVCESRAQKIPRPVAIGIYVLRSRSHAPGRRICGTLRVLVTFSHPDFTVGFGVSPNRALVYHVRLRAVPPVRT
jgi:hypothetical protein